MKDHPIRNAIQARGFALVATLSLMILLAILALGLLSLSAVTLRSAGQGFAQAEARANARMALMVAIGELQKQMGPDQRITARADSMANHPELEATVPTDSPQALWVGAASSDPEELIGAHQQPVVWLVSGLNPQASAADQLGDSPFAGGEVPLFGSGSINLDQTGGLPITAGLVPVSDLETGEITGSYAYFVDDNGMKAQLAPANHKLVNAEIDDRETGTVIPGAYDLGILDGMDGMKELPASEYAKLPSYNSLSLLGNGGNQIARNKRMGYTTSSLGVLSDVKRGGLKKDLTIAFEKHTTSSVSKFDRTYPDMPSYPVFDAIFPKTSRSEWGDYLLLEESKRGEFAEQGYIHWGMLRDYYNMKRYITRIDGRDTLAPLVLAHGELGGQAPYSIGILPPHEFSLDKHPMGKNMAWDTHRGMPYGDFNVAPHFANSTNIHELNREYIKHSPLVPVLGQLQFNLWLERTPATNPNNPYVTEALVCCNQLFVSHYNPYNINLQFNQRGRAFAYRNIPNMTVSIPGGQIAGLGKDYGHDAWGWKLHNNATPPGVTPRGINLSTLSNGTNGREYTVDTTEHLGPGRAMFCGFQKTGSTSDADRNDSDIYGTTIRDLVSTRAYKEYEIHGPLPSQLEWGVTFESMNCDLPGMVGQASQVLWGFWYDREDSEDKLTFSDLHPSTYNDNTMLRHSIRLHTTMEPGSSIRPLVDTNIRAYYANRRWDEPLGVGIASYRLVGSEDQSGAGEFMSQVPQMSPQADGKGYGYWGAEHEPLHGNDRVILFDVPREDLVSLGQLQHANVGRFSYEPSYIIGNSYANPRIRNDQWKGILTDTSNSRYKIDGPYPIYDASYLVNEVLWDGYTFTTIPQEADNYNDSEEAEPTDELFAGLLSRELLLPNPRHLPYQPPGSTFDLETLQADEAVHYNAGHILVDGAFNVNSTSVDAWEAFLSGTHGMPVQKIDGNGNIADFEPMEEDRVRFPRVQSVFGDEMTSDNPDENYWVGFRVLEQEEVRELAEAIVEEIRERGPFLSMAEFVNRKLEDGDHGHMGALQAALDKTINKNVGADFTADATHPKLPPNAKQAAGFPGQLLQGDILQALAPCMTVRSDTFTIRAYGESINPSTGEVAAKAWCEATVQRFPDPILESDSEPYLSELAQPGSRFGRQFRMTSFRWLNPDEI
jgi:hypothetical protein